MGTFNSNFMVQKNYFSTKTIKFFCLELGLPMATAPRIKTYLHYLEHKQNLFIFDCFHSCYKNCLVSITLIQFYQTF